MGSTAHDREHKLPGLRRAQSRQAASYEYELDTAKIFAEAARGRPGKPTKVSLTRLLAIPLGKESRQP